MKNFILFIVICILQASCSQLEQQGIDLAQPRITITSNILDLIPSKTKNDAIASLKISFS
ncbi:MAG: hypothetical protein HC892_22685 [Saprospiraceae bacterium]|nr:hypothetical protein [Saprospiraceae bacterium]